ncbi:MAG: hypothetical protein IIB19_00365 [Chloroflexi bacterium]|nr:hypothetical protein [Chloroflexota bacterium]
MTTLQDAQLAFYANSPAAALLGGRVWDFFTPVTVPAGNFTNIGLVTGARLVLVADLFVEVEGTRNFTVEFFEGGSFSGGSPLIQSPRNRANQGTPPYTVVDGGVTIDVVGVSIGKHHLGNQQRALNSVEAGGVILKASNTYYITFTNDDSQPAVSDIEILSAAVE